MNKKTNQTPSMKVIMLCHQVTLLAGSGGVQASRSDYVVATSDTWE